MVSWYVRPLVLRFSRLCGLMESESLDAQWWVLEPARLLRIDIRAAFLVLTLSNKEQVSVARNGLNDAGYFCHWVLWETTPCVCFDQA